MLFKAPEHFRDVLDKFFEGFTADQYVVDVDGNILVYQVAHDSVHHSRECGRGVTEAKGKTRYSYVPYLVLNAVLCWSFSTIVL